jgi:hypothetical protein
MSIFRGRNQLSKETFLYLFESHLRKVLQDFLGGVGIAQSV